MNSLILEIILFAAVAVFLLFRLRSVLGTRTGNEDNPELLRHGSFTRPKPSRHADPRSPLHPDNDNASDESARQDDDRVLRELPADDGRRSTVAEMQRADRGFRLDDFVDKARRAYEWIYLSFEQNDRERLRPLLADDVYEDFVNIIDRRDEEGLIVEARMVGVLDASVESVSYDAESNRAEIEVRFTAEVVRAVRNQNGEVVEGDPKAVVRRVDSWTFERELGSRDPNWILIEA